VGLGGSEKRKDLATQTGQNIIRQKYREVESVFNLRRYEVLPKLIVDVGFGQVCCRSLLKASTGVLTTKNLRERNGVVMPV